MPKARPILSNSLFGIGLEQLLAGVELLVDDRREDAVQVLDDALLALAERGLVGDLEDAAAGVGALAEQAAHGHAELVDGADDLFHLAGDDERRQVHHGRGADAGAEVGRARGQVAELRRERVVHVLLEVGIELVDRRPDLLELEPERRTWMRR